MLAGELDPLLDLALAAPIFDLALEPERRDVGGIELQHPLQLLQRQWIFLLLVSRAGALEKLRHGFLSRHLINLRAQQRDLRVEVAFSLELADDLAGELVVALLEGL